MGDISKPGPNGTDPVIAEAEIAEDAIHLAHHRPATEEDLRRWREEYFERDKARRRTDKQLAFLFLLTVVAFLVLAYRVESNDNRLSAGLYASCLARVSTANQYNVGREALVQQATSGDNAPKTAAARAELAKQLRAALLLPIENCGAPPR